MNRVFLETKVNTLPIINGPEAYISGIGKLGPKWPYLGILGPGKKVLGKLSPEKKKLGKLSPKYKMLVCSFHFLISYI